MASKVENIAINYVIQLEEKRGNEPIDRRKEKLGFDIESGNKIIEVKGRKGSKASLIHFNQYNFASMQEAIRDGKEYLLYIVKIFDDNSKKLKIMDVPEIISRAKVKHGYEIKFRKADFE